MCHAATHQGVEKYPEAALPKDSTTRTPLTGRFQSFIRSLLCHLSGIFSFSRGGYCFGGLEPELVLAFLGFRRWINGFRHPAELCEPEYIKPRLQDDNVPRTGDNMISPPQACT